MLVNCLGESKYCEAVVVQVDEDNDPSVCLFSTKKEALAAMEEEEPIAEIEEEQLANGERIYPWIGGSKSILISFENGQANIEYHT